MECGEEGLTFNMITTQADGSSVQEQVCIEPGEEPTPGQIIDIPGEVLTAFKQVDLPESVIVVQPPNGRTLVNFATLLSTEAAAYQKTVRLEKVGIEVVLEIWPTTFDWTHGDGTSQQTALPGKFWEQGDDVATDDDFVTHSFTELYEAVKVSVDTTWAAEFKVVGQSGWRPVEGTVRIEGQPVSLKVLEATPELVPDPLS